MDRTAETATECIKELETRNLMIHMTMTFLLSVLQSIQHLVDIDTWGVVSEAERRAFASLHLGGGWPARDALFAAKELSEYLDGAGIMKDHPLRKNLTEALQRIPWIDNPKADRLAG